MKKGFAIINFLIIISIIVFTYLSYNKFIKNSRTDNMELQNKISVQKNINSNEKINDQTPNNKPSSEGGALTSQERQAERIRNPKNPIIPLRENPELVENRESEIYNIIEETNSSGFYENTTYNYSISYPPEWPLKISTENNISIGTVPPKNGQGAITIEVGENSQSEIDAAKAEAQKYPGLIDFKEENISLAGVSGTKLTLTNIIAGTKDIYIILGKYGYDYAIKYSEESPEFVSQVENSLQTFQFTQ